jgi:hypothetical protein
VAYQPSAHELELPLHCNYQDDQGMTEDLRPCPCHPKGRPAGARPCGITPEKVAEWRQGNSVLMEKWARERDGNAHLLADIDAMPPTRRAVSEESLARMARGYKEHPPAPRGHLMTAVWAVCVFVVAVVALMVLGGLAYLVS